jgi:hypothetical protein
MPRCKPRHVEERVTVICCRGCGVPLAFADQGTLYIGTIFLRRKQPLPCQGCGVVTVWEPTTEQHNGHTG